MNQENTRERDRCIALAAVFQVARLVSDLARHGVADPQATEASIYSLFQIDPDSSVAVFGGLHGVALGLRELRAQIMSGNIRNTDIIRYAVSLLHLERKLAKRPELQEQIGDGMRAATRRLGHFSLLHDNILAQLADLYSETVSTLQPRILVQGEALHLQNSGIANRIRALLLAGIRAARLWQQTGGNRLRLLLGRKRLALTVDKLLSEIDTSNRSQ